MTASARPETEDGDRFAPVFSTEAISSDAASALSVCPTGSRAKTPAESGKLCGGATQPSASRSWREERFDRVTQRFGA